MKEINYDTCVSAAVGSSAFSHLLNLQKFDFYVILHLLQRLFGIIHLIHVKCQSRQATTGDSNDWIQELASALTTDPDWFGKELLAECKEQALNMKINLPVIPRVRRAFTNEEMEEYYVDLFRHGFEKAASALLRRYQSQPLEIANFLRCLLVDECMPSHSIKTVSEFYEDWSHADIARECKLLFARLRRQNR